MDDGTARIELRRMAGPSMYALADRADLSIISAHTWAATRGYKDIFYATTEVVTDGRRHRIYMHRLLLAAPPGACVDHINHDGLDNRRANIRLATTRQNAANMRARGRSAYKGVAWRSDRGYWRAQIKMNGKNTNLGGFATEIEAAHAYDAAARGRFRRVRVPQLPGGANRSNVPGCFTLAGWLSYRPSRLGRVMLSTSSTPVTP